MDGSLWRTIPLSEGGVVRAVKSRFATALTALLPENIAIIRRFISPSLFTNVLVTKAE